MGTNRLSQLYIAIEANKQQATSSKPLYRLQGSPIVSTHRRESGKALHSEENRNPQLMARSAGNMEMPCKPDSSASDFDPFSFECGVWEAFCDVKLGNKIASWLELLAMPPTPYNLGYRSALSDAKKCRRAALGQADPPKFFGASQTPSFNAMGVYGNK